MLHVCLQCLRTAGKTTPRRLVHSINDLATSAVPCFPSSSLSLSLPSPFLYITFPPCPRRPPPHRPSVRPPAAPPRVLHPLPAPVLFFRALLLPEAPAKRGRRHQPSVFPPQPAETTQHESWSCGTAAAAAAGETTGPRSRKRRKSKGNRAWRGERHQWRPRLGRS